MDYIGNRDPRQITNTNNVSVLDAMEQNLRLYGFDVDIAVDQRIEIAEVERICKLHPRASDVYGMFDSGLHTQWDDGCTAYVSHEGLNRWELGIIQDEYHSDREALHLLWGTTLEHQWPGTPVDLVLAEGLTGAPGVAMNTGAPGTEWGGVIENEFGVMVAADSIGSSNFGRMQSIAMHEVGHALGAGWADDTPIEIPGTGLGVVPKGMEVYSGDIVDPRFEADVTPEFIEIGPDEEPEWSVMSRDIMDARGFSGTNAAYPVFVFSIEELSTVDFQSVPSRDD